MYASIRSAKCRLVVRRRLERPRADQRLVDAGTPRSHPAPSAPVDLGLEPAVQRPPSRDRALPRAGQSPTARSAARARPRRAWCRASPSPTAPAGQLPLPLGHPVVHRRRIEAELRRIGADLVQREQPVVDVERRVLDALRRDRAGDLLELADEPRALLAFLAASSSASA